MTELERLQEENRRLRSRTVRAEEDAQHLRERLAACFQEVAATHAQIPTRVHQAAVPGAQRAHDRAELVVLPTELLVAWRACLAIVRAG